MIPVGAKDKSVVDMSAVATPVSDSDLLLVIQSGVAKKGTRAQVVRAIPKSVTMFHGGISGVYTAPTAATTNAELATAPMSRTLVDLQNVSQARLVVGMRTLGVGYTTALIKPRYASNGATQTTWVDLANTANAGNVSLLGGTANIIRATSWFDIASGAKLADAYLQIAFTSTGTGTTAATISFVDLLLR